MEYWVAYKIENGRFHFIAGTDDIGGPIHTTKEENAYKFYRFHVAMIYYSLGYCIEKRYI